ncbi:MAG TPA: hypothetical protein VNO52_12445 [Methylomirabilota bacterium]|nr:hypothetical protein [Methylomirabilota bacterium]
MFAAVYLPNFALQAALRHEPELWTRSVALVDPARATPVVCDMTGAARACGVMEGQTPTQALARCRDLTVRHRSPEREAAATDALLQCAFGFSPYVEATAPGLCTLDLRGLAVLSGATGAQRLAWAERWRAALAACGLRGQVGLAVTPNLAGHAARWSEGVTLIEDGRAFLATLPIAALQPSTDVATIFDKWGLRTVGELLALGQQAVVERLGLEALALFAAASATSMRPLRLARPVEEFKEAFEFEQPVETVEPLLFILRRFVDQLCPRLELLNLAAAALQLRLRLESGQRLEWALRVPQPTAQADVLFRMLHTHLETVRTSAPITAVALEASPGPRQSRQLGLFEAVLRDPPRFRETLARLAALLGADRVGTPVFEDSHRPDAFRLVPPDFENAPEVSPSALGGPPAAWPVRRLRPAVSAAVEVEAGDSCGRPMAIHCSIARGKLRVALGPWRASGQWWDAGAWQREEWDVETVDGHVLRLNRSPEGWSVEAIVD